MNKKEYVEIDKALSKKCLSREKKGRSLVIPLWGIEVWYVTIERAHKRGERANQRCEKLLGIVRYSLCFYDAQVFLLLSLIRGPHDHSLIIIVSV